MNAKQQRWSGAKWLGVGAGVAAASYATYVAATWLRYGHPAHSADPEEADALLDCFLPNYDVVERHHVRIAAPAESAFVAASNMNIQQSAIVRALFKGRGLILGSKAEAATQSVGLVAQAKAWGWGQLAEIPGREIVFGAATQPWLANPVFRALTPGDFVTFREPGYVKIAWTLRADPIGPAATIFRSETRAVATDPAARRKFRRYWSFLSPGIILIRWMAERIVKAEAERQSRETSAREKENPCSEF